MSEWISVKDRLPPEDQYLLDDAKYAELFPGSANAMGLNTFGEYAQLWLDSRGMANACPSSLTPTKDIV